MTIVSELTFIARMSKALQSLSDAEVKSALSRIYTYAPLGALPAGSDIAVLDRKAVLADRLWRSRIQPMKGLRMTTFAPLALDPRDPDPTREGIFRDHNCARCNSGAKPCVQGQPNRCEFPRARND